MALGTQKGSGNRDRKARPPHIHLRKSKTKRNQLELWLSGPSAEPGLSLRI